MLKKTTFNLMTIVILLAGILVVFTQISNNHTFAAQSPIEQACSDPKAQQENPYCKSISTPATPVENPVTKTIGKAVTLFAIIAGAVAVIWIMYGGFKFITSDGDSGRIEEARKTILYGVVGLVVLLSAQVLVTLILNAVT
jgi:hypothetical protein